MKTTTAPSNIKGRGNAPRRSETFKALQDIMKATEEAFNKAGKSKDFVSEWFVVGEWDNDGTASGVARGITHANTDRSKEGDQKVPGGFWLAGTERAMGSVTEVRARYLGSSLTAEHPMHISNRKG